jgi:sec-independent protein translocase protein TatA
MQRFLTVFALLVAAASAFAPPSALIGTGRMVIASTTPFADKNVYQPPALQRQRKSMASVQTMGLFGLGAPELVVIAIAAAFLLGPQKLAELGKDAGKIAGELKEVPKEFQAGMAEGEKQARAIKKEITGEPAEDATKE